jgi:hypothetical protein
VTLLLKCLRKGCPGFWITESLNVQRVAVRCPVCGIPCSIKDAHERATMTPEQLEKKKP